MNKTTEKTTTLSEEKREETKRLLAAFDMIPSKLDREKAVIFLEGMAAASAPRMSEATA